MARTDASALKAGRHRYAEDLRGRGAYWYFSATTFTLRRALLPLVAAHLRGRVLDAGAGGLHARSLLMPPCAEYVSADLANRHGDVDLVTDLMDMREVADGSFDAVFCSQVLEHLPDPRRALAEFRRVLKPGGRLLLAAPHLSALHEEPHDYFRYTPHGLRALLVESGFEVLAEGRAGGLLTFVSHPLSYAVHALCWRVPVLRWIAWAANVALVVLPAAGLDALLRTGRIWPTNVIAVARRP